MYGPANACAKMYPLRGLDFYPSLMQVAPIENAFAFGQCEARLITVSLKDTLLENQCNLIVSGKEIFKDIRHLANASIYLIERSA